jgi:hypothetical protein
MGQRNYRKTKKVKRKRRKRLNQVVTNENIYFENYYDEQRKFER